MGIPDTHTMLIPDFVTFKIEESSSSHDDDQTASCTQLFRRSFLRNKKPKELLGPPVSLDGDPSVKYTRERLINAINITEFTPSEIKQATRNYSTIIGRGGSGSIYKGTLPNNQVIAVKRGYQEKSIYCNSQFFNEITISSQINNKNVVKLLGVCFDKEVPSIVYEYMPNGTLDDHLFDEQKSYLLNWNHRLRIAAQVAEVLAYLHNTIRVPIVHRDIKPSNILLGDNYIAKVSDFGISKLGKDEDKFYMVGEESEDIRESDEFTTSTIIGTYGYLDPEYVCDSRPSKKSDVYSFGVVLAQILTRKRAVSIDLERGDGLLVTRFAKKLKEDCLEEILDEQLVNEGSMDQLTKVAHLAKWCSELKKEDRPTMRQVVRELQDIRGF